MDTVSQVGIKAFRISGQVCVAKPSHTLPIVVINSNNIYEILLKKYISLEFVIIFHIFFILSSLLPVLWTRQNGDRYLSAVSAAHEYRSERSARYQLPKYNLHDGQFSGGEQSSEWSFPSSVLQWRRSVPVHFRGQHSLSLRPV